MGFVFCYSFTDIEKVETFGFRGQALSALATIANLQITTNSRKNTKQGQLLTFDATGKAQKLKPAARDRGTTTKITNLFHSLPVRSQEYKKNHKLYYSKAIALLHEYALIILQRRIVVYNSVSKG